jgi:hypothetical protein
MLPVTKLSLAEASAKSLNLKACRPFRTNRDICVPHPLQLKRKLSRIIRPSQLSTSARYYTALCPLTLPFTFHQSIHHPHTVPPCDFNMQFSATSITTLLLAALTGQALGAPAVAPAAEDTSLLEKRCDCACNVACQKNCQNGFALSPFGVGVCVLGCAPNCGCSENSKC